MLSIYRRAPTLVSAYQFTAKGFQHVASVTKRTDEVVWLTAISSHVFHQLFGPFCTIRNKSCRFRVLRSNTRCNVFDPVIYFAVWCANASESVMGQNNTNFSLHQTAFFISRKKFEMSFLPELMRSDRREVILLDSSLWTIQLPWEVYITLDNARGSLLCERTVIIRLESSQRVVKEDVGEGSFGYESFWSRFGRLRFSVVVLWQSLCTWQMRCKQWRHNHLDGQLSRATRPSVKQQFSTETEYGHEQWDNAAYCSSIHQPCGRRLHNGLHDEQAVTKY